MILVDSSVILDVLTRDHRWFEWSAGQLQHFESLEDLAINPLLTRDPARVRTYFPEVRIVSPDTE